MDIVVRRVIRTLLAWFWWCLLGIRRVVIISSTVEAGKKEGDAEKLTGCGGNNLLKLVRESAGA